LNRKALDSSVFQDPIIWQVWCWCLMKATFQKQKFPFNGKDMELLPGQFITGRVKAVEELNPKNYEHGVTPQKYRTAMNYLKSTQRITIKTTNKFSLVTVINWSIYQTDNTVPNQRATSQQPATNHIQERKELKNDKNILLGSKILKSASIPGYCTDCFPWHDVEEPHTAYGHS